MSSSSMRASKVGWRVSAVLAVIYVLVTIASLLLVGIETTNSWQATFLGMKWNTILGFEIGLVGMVIIGFAVAAVFVLIANLIEKWLRLKSKTSLQADQPPKTPSRPWSIWVLAVCFVLPALVMITLRWLAPWMSSSAVRGPAGPAPTGSGAQINAMNMGPGIDTAMREAEPTFTGDGRTMYFNCNNADICVTHLLGDWEDGNWTAPQVVGPPISSEYEEVEPLINAAGDKLYFNSNRPKGGLRDTLLLSPFTNVFEVVNMIASGWGISLFHGFGLGEVWVSYKVNGIWSEPRLVNELPDEPPVNSTFHDHCLSFSSDGNEAFWTSTRPGGFGHNDIWTSRRVNGQWSTPANLGSNVNGPGDEHHSIPAPDGQSLYVTSDRSGGYGGEDIYVTKRGNDGKWGPLVNLGPLINGPANDRCGAWTPDLRYFLFDSVRAGGFGGKDIWWIYFKDVRGYPLASTASEH